jgi:hypothetical protein
MSMTLDIFTEKKLFLQESRIYFDGYLLNYWVDLSSKSKVDFFKILNQEKFDGHPRVWIQANSVLGQMIVTQVHSFAAHF